MAKRKAPIAIGSVNALEKKRIIDRSERVIKPEGGVKQYEVDTPKPQDDTTRQTAVLSQEIVTPPEGVNPKPTKITEERVGRTIPPGVTKEKTPLAQGKVALKAAKENSKPHALSVPLRLQEYKMYYEVIQRINALGPSKKVAGTDVQRASIHLLYKMTPEKILKAHLESIMTVGSPEDNDEKKALSVLLQPREHKMFSKIIDKINALGVSKKIKGTDIQRASIYLLYKMKPERIIKAHYNSLMP